ncbi:hypothetical protein B0H14DRAFT_1612354 [Mycena olivaceomarginata]|nr:hypothetical protein B0H14DRAFT_1612354 [Mycena olivaceomarginata]
MSALVPHRARWEHLGLQTLTYLLRGIEGPMPLLRSLNLRLLNRDSTQFSFLDAPLLHTAILNDYAAETLTLPWAQLTSLTLCRVFPRECVPILRHASSLVYCELDLVEDSEDVPDITLPYLRSLTLTGHSVMRYLETLIIPALHDLCIPESFLGPKPTETLTSFISKSGCTLGELCITSPQFTSRSLLQSIHIDQNLFR